MCEKNVCYNQRKKSDKKNSGKRWMLSDDDERALHQAFCLYVCVSV